VAFLDLDAELLAPRYRAAEQAMALVARAARLVGGKAGGGRLLLQTKLPRHEVVQAALLADPERLSNAEAHRREPLGWPPFTALAHVSGPPSEEFVRALSGVQVLGPADGAWLVRAPTHDALCAALAAVPRPGGRLRVAVDPLRL
jgi:primosomal protein N' (replication factor Y)